MCICEICIVIWSIGEATECGAMRTHQTQIHTHTQKTHLHITKDLIFYLPSALAVKWAGILFGFNKSCMQEWSFNYVKNRICKRKTILATIFSQIHNGFAIRYLSIIFTLINIGNDGSLLIFLPKTWDQERAFLFNGWLLFSLFLSFSDLVHFDVENQSDRPFSKCQNRSETFFVFFFEISGTLSFAFCLLGKIVGNNNSRKKNL